MGCPFGWSVNASSHGSLFPTRRNPSAGTRWPEKSVCDLLVPKTVAGATLTLGAGGLEGGKVSARGGGSPGPAAS